MTNILVVVTNLCPPWNDGIKVYARGLIECIEKIDETKVDVCDLDNGVRKSEYDFVHILYPTGPKTVMKAMNRFHNAVICKHIFTPANGLWHGVNSKFFYAIIETVGTRLVKCFSSEFVANSFLAKSGLIIPPPINTRDFQESDERPVNLRSILENAHTKVGIDNIIDHEDIILYCGPLTHDRFPYERVLSGVKEAKRCKILIIGRNLNSVGRNNASEIVSYSKKLGIEDLVTVTMQTLNEEEKLALMNSASIVIQPFNKKLQNLAIDPPLFLLEAMACSKPVIVSKTYSLGSIIKNGFNGYAIDWNNSDELQNAIVSCLEDNNIKRNARNTIVQDFSIDSVADRLKHLYNDFS